MYSANYSRLRLVKVAQRQSRAVATSPRKASNYHPTVQCLFDSWKHMTLTGNLRDLCVYLAQS